VGGRRQRQAVTADHRPGVVPPNAALAVQQHQGLLDPVRVASERLGKPSAAGRLAVIQEQVECSGQQGMLECRAAAEVWEVWLPGHVPRAGAMRWQSASAQALSAARACASTTSSATRGSATR
jgi:hypothetical protein